MGNLPCQPDELERLLRAQARQFLSSAAKEENDSIRSFLIADLEFIWCRDSHKLFAGDTLATVPIRWPFDRLAAACWIRLQFVPGQAAPLIDNLVLMSGDDHPENQIASAFFETLFADRAVKLMMWGSEQRDLPVLRRAAMAHSLLLPPQLANSSPKANGRIDLCREVTGLGDKAKLAELAASLGFPAKPIPADQIGKLAERGLWQPVREQNLADVAVTALLAARYLNAVGEVRSEPVATDAAIVEAFSAGFPASAFATRTLAGWSRARTARSKLRGLVPAAA